MRTRTRPPVAPRDSAREKEAEAQMRAQDIRMASLLAAESHALASGTVYDVSDAGIERKGRQFASVSCLSLCVCVALSG